MTSMANPIGKLAELLEKAKAKPLLTLSRLAPSPTYDMEYRCAVVAMIFKKFARPFESKSDQRMLASKLKLLQFITLRPWLLPAVREWSYASTQAELELAYSVRIRRGFLSDTAHEDVVDFLLACEILYRSGHHLVTGQNSRELDRIVKAVTEHNLFRNESEIIADLAAVKLTKSMLEGW
jgi:hypothetical protein